MIEANACSATWGFTAATAATGCPLYNAFPLARMFMLRKPKLWMDPSAKSVSFMEVSGQSAEVTTAYTPESASAALVSTDLMTA